VDGVTVGDVHGLGAGMVDGDDVVAGFGAMRTQIVADETTAACDQRLHVGIPAFAASRYASTC